MMKLYVLLLAIIAPMTMVSSEPPIYQEEVGELADSLSHLPEREREQVLEVMGFDWKDSGTHKLPLSNSTISLPEGNSLLIGADAKRARELSDASNDDDVEAVVFDESWEHLAIFEYINSGFVSINDWEKIDPNALLKDIRKNTKKANIERRKREIEELFVVGWMQKPTLDRSTNTVYWAIEARGEEEGDIVNAVALRLGRYGFERVVWVTPKDLYVPVGGYLDVMLSSHAFDVGHRYQDFVDGDRIAEYGIAALIATKIGGKVGQAIGLLSMLKKFGAFVIAAIVGAFYKIKSLLRKGEENPSRL